MICQNCGKVIVAPPDATGPEKCDKCLEEVARRG